MFPFDPPESIRKPGLKQKERKSFLKKFGKALTKLDQIIVLEQSGLSKTCGGFSEQLHKLIN